MNVLIATGKLEEEIAEGTQKSVVNLANQLSKDVNVDWLTRPREGEGNPPELSEDVDVVRTPINPSAVFSVRQKVEEIDPDVINVHTLSNKMALFWKLNFPSRTLVTFPGYREWNKGHRTLQRFFRKTVSCKYSEKWVGGTADFTPYSIDTEKYKPENDVKTDENLTITYLGSPDRKRGFDQACKALSHLDINFTFQIAVAERKGARETVERKLEKYGITENTDADYRFINDLNSYLNRSDILLNLLDSCESVTCPPVLTLEAMSCGRVVICSDLPPFHDAIEDGTNGFLMDNQESEKIAEKIEYLQNNPERAGTISKEARETIANEYNIEDSTKRFMEKYEEMN